MTSGEEKDEILTGQLLVKHRCIYYEKAWSEEQPIGRACNSEASRRIWQVQHTLISAKSRHFPTQKFDHGIVEEDDDDWYLV